MIGDMIRRINAVHPEQNLIFESDTLHDDVKIKVCFGKQTQKKK